MDNNRLESIEKSLKNINAKIALIGNTLNIITDELGDDNEEFQRKFIASTLSVESFRDSFTKYVNEEGDDDIKFTMIELNNMIEGIKNGE
tara:strand:+ start:1649 stop:1918 length:270 start_codon:yes stop_codon:yes gene_type:complete